MNVLVFVDLLFSVHLFVFVFFYIRGLLREREKGESELSSSELQHAVAKPNDTPSEARLCQPASPQLITDASDTPFLASLIAPVSPLSLFFFSTMQRTDSQ